MNVEHRERERINPVTLGVVVPILQSLVTGFLAGVFGAAVSYAVGAKFVPALGIGALVGIVVTLLMWLVLFMGRWQPLLEEILQVDLNGDGIKGAPEPRKEIRIIVERDGGQRASFLDLPFDEGQFRQFVVAVLAGNTSVVAMDAVGINRAQVEEARQMLFDRDLAQWRRGGQNQGWELTPDGRRAFTNYLRGK